jgi:transposase-like protein
MRPLPQEIIHLHLHGRLPHPLVQDEEDWHVLSAIALRMVFWCGGSIHGCRCEGPDMRFAVEMRHASAGAAAHHISGAYGIHLRRRRGWTGSIFKHYVAIPIDAELFLDELVLWLHRPPESTQPEAARPACWTAASAYLIPNSMAWIRTDCVLAALSPGGAGRSTYIRRMAEPITSETMAILTGGTARRSQQAADDERAARSTVRRKGPDGSNIEKIAQFVADYSHVSYEDMRSASRKRAVSKAKVLAAVLCARNGASVAAVARLFGRSRSTLIERAERYRETQPQLFAHAERALDAHLQREYGRDHQYTGLGQTHVDRQCAKSAPGAAILTGAHADGVEDGVASLSKR